MSSTSTRVCAITGASGGIGKAAAIQLARDGLRVRMLARESEKSQQALEEIRAASGSADVHLHPVELASFDSIREVARRLSEAEPHLDVLVNNAGLFKRRREESEDGFEMTLAVNYLAPFLLTNELLPLLRKGRGSRIVNVTSELYKQGRRSLAAALSPPRFDGSKAYADSKMLLQLFTLALDRRLSGEGIAANSVHPGVIATDAFREYPRWFVGLLGLFLAGPEVGARPLVRLATGVELEGRSGRYFCKLEETPLAGAPVEESALETLWTESARAAGLEV